MQTPSFSPSQVPLDFGCIEVKGAKLAAVSRDELRALELSLAVNRNISIFERLKEKRLERCKIYNHTACKLKKLADC